MSTLATRYPDGVNGRRSQSLLHDKLVPPEAAGPVLRRSRLLTKVSSATEHRVTALDAPAGSGKTVLLATWLKMSRAPRVAWLSLDQDDNDPRIFWSYLVESLRLAGRPLARLAVPDTVDDTFAARVVDAAAQLAEPVVLVLDDVHELRGAAVLHGLETLLRHAPAPLRLVLSGREQPAVPLARLRVSGDLIDIGFDDLACTPAEARQLFALLGLEISDGDTALALERAEGWITGLRLASLWWQDQPPGSRSMADFGGDARIVADYLNDEVLHAQSAESRTFLLRTCVVDELTGALADALTGDQHGAHDLDRLERQNALVTAFNPQRTCFRYRRLLRDFLRAELNRVMPREASLLHTRAARYYAQQEWYAEALRAAVAADDTDLATSLLTEHGHRMLADGRVGDLDPLLRSFPDDQVSGDPALAAVHAHARLRMADADGAEPYLRIAGQTAELGPEGDLHQALIYAELRLFQASLRGFSVGEQMDLAHRTLDRATTVAMLPHDQAALGALSFRLGMAHITNGEAVAARTVLERALPHLAGAPASSWELASAWHALVNATEGRLAVAEATISTLDEGTGPAGLLDLTRALIWVERDRLDQAWSLLERPDFGSGGSCPGDGGELPLGAAAALIRARILIARSRYPAARRVLAAARRHNAGLSPHIRHRADLFEAEILLRQGQLDAARQQLNRALAEQPVPDLAISAVATGQFRLAEGDLAGALDVVTPCLEGTTAETRLLDTVGAHLVAASAQRRLRAPAVARKHLEHALTLAEPEELLRVFVDAGRSIRSLLTVMIPPDGPHWHVRAVLLHHFESQSVVPHRPDRAVPALTESEAAVLHYLPSMMTNDEIAQDLCLSVNTIKSHLRTLYRKLDATNRREAIVRAREHDLL